MNTAILGNNGLTTTRQPDGSLVIEGYLTRWHDADFAGDRMQPGSFREAIREFMAPGRANRPLVHHHELAAVLGEVLHLEEDSEGVRLRARVDFQPESSPLRWIYNAIKAGSMRGLSAMATWVRKANADGTRSIVKARNLIECSVTASPYLSTAKFEVVSEGKALQLLGLDDPLAQLRLERDLLRHVGQELDLLALRAAVLGLRAQVAGR